MNKYKILEIVNSYSLARDKIAAEHGNITYEYFFHKFIEKDYNKVNHQTDIPAFINLDIDEI